MHEKLFRNGLWCRWGESPHWVMLSKIRVVLQVAVSFVCVSVQSTGWSLTATMQELTLLWWEQSVLFGFCSGVAACAASRSYCYCQKKIKTNLAWLIKAMSINGFFSNCQEVSISDVIKTDDVQTSLIMLFLNFGMLEIAVICPGLLAGSVRVTVRTWLLFSREERTIFRH